MTQGKLDEALLFAKSINDDSLFNCIERIKQGDKNWMENRGIFVETKIFTDFAPYSFEFARFATESDTERFVGNGGIIFHGKHDNGGDGGAPTFSVCLEPCSGWQIHT